MLFALLRRGLSVQNEHLRQLLARSQTELNRALAGAQKSSGDLATTGESKDGANGQGSFISWDGADDLPPWVVDPDVMVPLLVAYDRRIEELEEGNAAMGDTLRAAQDKATALTDENAALRTDLQRAVTADLEAATQDPAGAAAASRGRLLMDESKAGGREGNGNASSLAPSTAAFGGLASGAGGWGGNGSRKGGATSSARARAGAGVVGFGHASVTHGAAADEAVERLGLVEREAELLREEVAALAQQLESTQSALQATQGDLDRARKAQQTTLDTLADARRAVEVLKQQREAAEARFRGAAQEAQASRKALEASEERERSAESARQRSEQEAGEYRDALRELAQRAGKEAEALAAQARMHSDRSRQLRASLNKAESELDAARRRGRELEAETKVVRGDCEQMQEVIERLEQG